MTPRPQEEANLASTMGPELAGDSAYGGEEIVISGISGSFPDSDGVYNFRDNLMNKLNLISDDERRWNKQTVTVEFPHATGKVSNLDKFDAGFFGYQNQQAHISDPNIRGAYERVYEAIIDAGINPQSLRGTRTGVFACSVISETEALWVFEQPQPRGNGLLNATRGLMANRFSYLLGLEGPSYVADTACSSSLFALDRAVESFRSGQCDAAIVISANTCLHPVVSKNFHILGVLSDDSKCKCFDQSANGYARSEAIVAVFLQKAKDARRVYARVVHSKVNCDGYKDSGITFPSRVMQLQLLLDFYDECKVDPRTVSFVEAHATGTVAGDPEESNAIDQAFCTGRTEPLLIGSVKSNMGHSEPSSGLCSIAKAIIAMETGLIPPNINYSTPREGIPGISEGRLKVVTEPTPLPGDKGLVAVSSFGFGGGNAHVLLEWNHNKKKPLADDNIPRVLAISGRTQEAITEILNDVKSRPLDLEFLQLINDVFLDVVPGHEYRGFGIYTVKGEQVRGIKAIDWISSEPSNKHLTLSLSGLESRVPHLVVSLVKIPQFISSIEASHSALHDVGFDVMNVLFDQHHYSANILNGIVGSVAFQIAIVDCLGAVGATIDSLLGSSLGEITCAYATRSITAQQAIRIAYYTGKALLDANLPKTSTLAIDLDAKAVQQILPKDVDISVVGVNETIVVGLPSTIQALAQNLQSKGVKSRLTNSYGVGLHSRYSAKARQSIKDALQQVLPMANRKRDNWVTSSPQNLIQGENISSYCSAQFFAHMLTSPIDLASARNSLPSDSIVLEASNQLSLGQTLALTDVTAKDNSIQFLSAIGNLYLLGINVNVTALCPRQPYPVSRSTPMIAPLIRWDHSRDWFINRYLHDTEKCAGEHQVIVDLKTNSDAFLKGHTIDGRILYPATGYIILVLDFMVTLVNDPSRERIYVFKNVQFLRATTLSEANSTKFLISIQKSTGKFEISEGGSVIVTGAVESHARPAAVTADPSLLRHGDVEKDTITLSLKDVYKELRLRGYHYSGAFRGLEQVDSSGRFAKLRHNDNLIPFIDTMLQLSILNINSRDLYVPVSIGKLVIDVGVLAKDDALLNTEQEEQLVDLDFYRDIGVVKSGGVEVWNLRAQQIPRRKNLGEPVLEKYSFAPSTFNVAGEEDNRSNVLRFLVHLALENSQGMKVKTLELADEDLPVVSGHVSSVLLDLPLIQADVQLAARPSSRHILDLPSTVTVNEDALDTETELVLVIGKNLLGKKDILNKALAALKPDGFFITRDQPSAVISEEEFSILGQRTTNGEKFTLLRKKRQARNKPEVVRILPGNDFSWIQPLKDAIQSKATRVILVSEKDKTSGIIGLTNCLRQEYPTNRIRSVFIRDEKAPAFDLDLPLYADQLAKDMVINIYENGQWGTYRHQALPDLIRVPSQHVYVNNAIRGDISSLTLFQGPLNKRMLRGEKDLIKVCYAAINFRDVMLCSGKITLPSSLTEDNELQIGFEFSGIDSKGQRVMGLVNQGAMTTAVEKALVTWPVPDNMTLAEAATIPCLYTTVYLCLIVNGKARAGESVLIHSGAGGIGLTAINMALKLGLNVFVTVGTSDKRKFMRENYPQIPESHIGNSRDITFVDMIQRETQGRGVDMVLNSLADDKFQASVRCLAPGGRFLEIGKYDLLKNSNIDMDQFAKGISFHSIMVDVAMRGATSLQNVIVDAINHCFKNNLIVPLPKTVFDLNESEKAFRFMASGKHIGKVLLKVRDEVEVGAPKSFSAVPRFFCNPKGTYIICGGLGGFGLELSNWLVSRGARSVVVTSRKGIQNGFQERTTQIWRRSGVNVKISTDDISTEQGVTNLLTTANAMAPVVAIYNLAVVLRDAVFENQTEDAFKASFSGKANATAILDRVSRKLCPALEEFVVFSSVSCGRGNAGQTNYGMSNSVMERICERRKAEGLPALAIQWGAIGEVGLVAEMAESNLELVIGGTLQQTISSCLQALDVFLVQDAPVVASMVVAEKRSLRKAGETMVEAVCSIIGIKDIKTVSSSTTLTEVGMDSMTGVEIKQMIERDFEVFLSAQELRSMTFGKLAELDQALKSGVQLSGEVDKSEIGIEFLVSSTDPEEELIVPACQLTTASSAGSPVIFVPGLDGVVSNFHQLAQGLTVPAVALRYSHKRTDITSIQQTAEYMVKNIPSPVDLKNFKMVAYSAGGMVALEMAAILERQGGKGQVVLIDGAPLLISTLAKQLGFTSDPAEVDNLMIISIQESITAQPANEDKLKYRSLKTRDEKMKYFRSKTKEGISKMEGFTEDYVEACAVDAIQRMHNIMGYRRSDARLKSKITLIKPSLPTAPLEDFGLAPLSEGPIEEYTVTGNHASMLRDPEITTVLNNILKS